MKRLLLTFLTLISLSANSMIREKNFPLITEDQLHFPKSSIDDCFQISVAHGKEELGFILYSLAPFSRNKWEIHNMYIDPDYRNKGFASKLFKECFEDILSQKAITISWKSSPIEGNLTPKELVNRYIHIVETKIMPVMPGSLDVQQSPSGYTLMVYRFKK